MESQQTQQELVPLAGPFRELEPGEFEGTGPVPGDLKVDLARVEQLAAQGMNNMQIAQCLGYDEQYLHKRGEGSRNRIRKAMEKGRANGIARVTESLLKSCDRGSIEAQKFFLSRRAPKDWGAQRESDPFADLGLEAVSVEQLELVVSRLTVTAKPADHSKLLDI